MILTDQNQQLNLHDAVESPLNECSKVMQFAALETHNVQHRPSRAICLRELGL
jgi:hypothetical protein